MTSVGRAAGVVCPLQQFVIPLEQYISEGQEFAAAYAPPVNPPPNPDQDLGTTAGTLDGSEPCPIVTRPERRSTRH